MEINEGGYDDEPDVIYLSVFRGLRGVFARGRFCLVGIAPSQADGARQEGLI